MTNLTETEVNESLSGFVSEEIFSNTDTLISSYISKEIDKTFYANIQTCLRDSVAFEKDEPDDKIITNLIQYSHSLFEYEAPNLLSVFEAFKPGFNPNRTDHIFTGSGPLYPVSKHLKGFGTVEVISTSQIGMNPKILASDGVLDKIQNIINIFYKKLSNGPELNDLIEGFRLYIVFESIHPFDDGNGRIGRFIFLEHAFKYSLFPLSTIIVNIGAKHDHLDLFKQINKKDKVFILGDELYDFATSLPYLYKKGGEYFDFKPNEQTMLTIYKLIYKTIVYRKINKVFPKNAVHAVKFIINSNLKHIEEKIETKKHMDRDKIYRCLNLEIHDKLSKNR